jgi:hypothetical protein
MAIGWFICPFKRKTRFGQPVRYCAMNDFTATIRANGGRWSEVEFLGDRTLVKVNASAATLTTIAGTATFRRIPLAALNDSLSTLSSAQRTAIRDELLSAGYTLAEFNAAIPNLATATLGDVLRFALTRRKRARFDQPTGTIICDGPDSPCPKTLAGLNAEVT